MNFNCFIMSISCQVTWYTDLISTSAICKTTMDDMKYLLALEEETYLLLAAALILEKPEPDEQLPAMFQILS